MVRYCAIRLERVVSVLLGKRRLPGQVSNMICRGLIRREIGMGRLELDHGWLELHERWLEFDGHAGLEIDAGRLEVTGSAGMFDRLIFPGCRLID
jgi:hypothetical protein